MAIKFRIIVASYPHPVPAVAQLLSRHFMCQAGSGGGHAMELLP